jgi:4-carboxymuconolactone decarboxylase
MHDRTRFDMGIDILKQVGGPDYAQPLEALNDVAPDLVRFTIEFAYGDVMSRPALDLKTRQLATVAALAAMARVQPQLRFHINGALNVGCSPAEIVEVILLCTVYAGFPAALNGAFAANEVFQQRGISFAGVPIEESDERYARGMRTLEAVSAGAGAEVIRNLRDIAPDLARYVIEFSYGDIIVRPVVSHRIKELCAVAMLTALGTAQPQLKVHIAAALNVGACRDEIVEVIQQMAVYAGFPAALNGVAAAKQVFASSAAAT